jgi:hypothetical protein
MAGGQRLISWLHPWSTSNVALNTHTCAHGPLMGHPNWVGCDSWTGEVAYHVSESPNSVALEKRRWRKRRRQCKSPI